ncbi:MAG: hypothetical protein MUO99_08630 [Dehalococcoidales bacterium]|nr:hypothetical protein [Dehalococcoidales bacterium]
MSLRTNSDAKQLLASLSPAVLDSLADLIVTKLQAGDPLCLLPKQDVVGSNPITRSMKLKGKAGVLDVSEVIKVAHHCMYRPEGSPEVTGEVTPAKVQDG